jgi:hypothetical protein
MEKHRGLKHKEKEKKKENYLIPRKVQAKIPKKI